MLTPWTLVSAASQQRIKPSDQGIFQLDWTLGLIRLVFTSSGPYETTCIERSCCRCYRICIWKTSTTNNEEDGRKTKEKMRDRRRIIYYLVEYEAARFVDHKQIVDSRRHCCHKTTRELLLLPPRETIANATSEQSTKASGSGNKRSAKP